jgi:hypothetical protein
VSTQGDPAALYYLAPIPICGPYSNFEPRVAQQLLKNCHQTHDQCRSPLETRLPKRLLDCGEARTCSHVRLREIENGESGQYTALSYAWGNNENLLTTRDNLLAHTNGIDFCALPNTVKDAVQVTCALDLRYLWVDALCIIQDSAKDMIKELERMSEYYRNAYCVIAASASHGADEGFLKPWYRSRRFPMFGKLADVIRSELNVPFLGPDGERGTIALNITSPDVYLANKNPLSQRAWALQERLLCSRYLHFPVDQGFALQCDHEEQFAGKIVYDSSPDYAGHQARCGRSRMLQGTPLEDGSAFAVPDLPIEVNEIWRTMVEEYSSMKLSFSSDKLVAIAALAESYHRNYDRNPGSYFAGHWRGELVESLWWFTRSEWDSESRPFYRAPSWSWASIEGTIYHWTDGLPAVETIDIIDVGTTLLHPSLPFGAVTDGYLIVQGRLHRTLWRLRRPSESTRAPEYDKACLLLPQLAGVPHKTWFNFDGSLWLSSFVFPDILLELGGPNVLAEPVEMLLLSSNAYSGSHSYPKSRVLLLQMCGRDTYQRVGFAYLGGDVDHGAIFQGEKKTIRII